MISTLCLSLRGSMADLPKVVGFIHTAWCPYLSVLSSTLVYSASDGN